MSLKRMCVILVITGLLPGCASTLSNSIEQRLAISEQCRLATSALPPEFEIPSTLVSIQLGNVGRCSLDPTQTLLPMCSIKQIMRKYNLDHVPDDFSQPLAAQRAARLESLGTLDKAVKDLRTDFEALAGDIGDIDAAIRDWNDTSRTAALAPADTAAQAASLQKRRYEARTRWLQAMRDKSSSVEKNLKKVRISQYEVQRAVTGLSAMLEPAARIELEAWDANLRIQLSRFEEVLSGSEALAVREGVKDLVLTHVARRTLEMLHNSLKTADAVLRQLDEKAYGAVSIGYLAFGPDVQKAVNTAFSNIKATYEVRQNQKNDDPNKSGQAGLSTDPPPAQTAVGSERGTNPLLTRPMLRELRRAACENLVQATQFSMLTELIDTMIILQVEKEDPILRQLSPAAPVAEQTFPEDRTHTIGRSNVPGEIAPITTYAGGTSFAAAAAGQGTDEGHAAQSTVTPAGVHMANAWAARQQLLTQAIAARRQSGASGADQAGQSAQGVDMVDEDTVQRLADVATAKVIDDAVRLSPAAIELRGRDLSDRISSNVSVVTAATAVSQASVTLKLNLSVSNVNHFSPTNYNNVTPVINLALPIAATGPAAASAPSLCADAGLARAGAHCTRGADGYVIGFAHRSFRSDSCLASDLEPALTAIGQSVAAYRARHGIEHQATVEGYASVPPAVLARCKAAAGTPELACKYSNQLRASADAADCRADPADRNVVLSAARAKNAARVLESAAQGALVVTRLVAKGAQGALADGSPASRDQTILIRLSPRAAD